MDLSSARRYEVVTPSDTADQAGGRFRALHIGVAGTVQVVERAGASPVPFVVVSGQRLDIEGVRVNATGTTATSIVAMY